MRVKLPTWDDISQFIDRPVVAWIIGIAWFSLLLSLWLLHKVGFIVLE